MKPPKAGSRKAEVYAVFIKSGLDAAIEKAVSLELKANTVKAWASSWGHKGPKGERTPKNGGTEAPARAPKAAHDRQHIHFDIPTRERAIVVLQGIMRRAGTAQAAYHILEQGGKFGVVPAHLAPDIKVPQFKKGDWVCDTIIPNTLGQIVESGPQVCTVRYETPRPMAMGNETHIPNVYLVKMPDPEPVKPTKKSRVKIEEKPDNKELASAAKAPDAKPTKKKAKKK